MTDILLHSGGRIGKKELKKYGAQVKEKIEVYKKMREELASMRSELVLLQRTETILRGRDANLEQFLTELERQKGVEVRLFFISYAGSSLSLLLSFCMPFFDVLCLLQLQFMCLHLVCPTFLHIDTPIASTTHNSHHHKPLTTFSFPQGYRETQRALVEMTEKTAEIDQLKGATLEDISAMVESITREFKNKQQQLQPLIAELKVCSPSVVRLYAV